MTNPNGRFGIHGGQYIPETLMNAVIELEEAYNHYKTIPNLTESLPNFSTNTQAGLKAVFAAKMTKDLGGAKLPQT